ncbi:MAG: ribonuclease III [Pseudomonadota bacterium]
MNSSQERWLEQVFGCRLKTQKLFRQALSHRSVAGDNNERLEFFGDAVLGCYVSEELYLRFPEADEGQLSRLRVALVKGSALAELSREIGLGDQLILGAGEKHGGGRHRDSILADTLEAIFGAIAVDLGQPACRDAIHRVFKSRFENLALSQADKDPKTRLQEFLQGIGRPLPHYELVATSGADHERVFTVRCFLEDEKREGQGQGASRRAAEQLAAEVLFAKLESGS